MATETDSALDTDIRITPEGVGYVALRGHLDAQTVPACWNDLTRALSSARVKSLEVDASRVRLSDGAGLALLRYVNMGRMTPGAAVSVHGLEAGMEKVFHEFTDEDYQAYHSAARARVHSLPEEV